jgi:RimJ/RimL family protein N-acetyltransferase
VQFVKRYFFLAAGIVLCCVCLVLGVVTTFKSTSVVGRTGTFDCGSLWTPRNPQACVRRTMESENSRNFALALAVGGAVLAAAGLLVVRPPLLVLGPIVGQRLVLRSARPKDTDALMSTIDSIMTTENHWSPEDLVRFEVSLRCGALAHELTIWSISDKCIVGGISARRDPKIRGQRELGIWIGPAFRHRGFASEALALLASHLHERGIRRIVAESAETNDRVRRAFLVAGFTIEGTGQHLFADGDEVASIFYLYSPVSVDVRASSSELSSAAASHVED